MVIIVIVFTGHFLEILQRVGNHFRGKRDKQCACVYQELRTGVFAHQTRVIQIDGNLSAAFLDSDFRLPANTFMLVPSIFSYKHHKCVVTQKLAPTFIL